MSQDSTPHLAICADDFGQGSAIDQGILQLLQQGRLQAVSCLVGGPTWATHAAALVAAAARANASLGLHFNLTHGAPLTAALRAHWPAFPGLLAVLRDSHLQHLPLRSIALELQAQLQAFSCEVGHPPRHIDGHQHVHHLPGVRGLILAAAAACVPPAALRRCTPLLGPGAGFKRAVIQATGARALGRSIDALALRSNRTLVGVYDFAPTPAYRHHMQGWLRSVAALPNTNGHGALLFCHPALAGTAPAADDPIAAARQLEMTYLGSETFALDLVAAGVTLAPVW